MIRRSANILQPTALPLRSTVETTITNPLITKKMFTPVTPPGQYPLPNVIRSDA